MLTAARLVAGILFAMIGYEAARQFADVTFPEGMRHVWFEPSIAAIGLWQGWTVMGAAHGRGFITALGNGFRTSIGVAFFSLIAYALREMFRRSANLRYSDFGVAVYDALELFLEYAGDLANVTPAWATLVLGGLAAGIATEIAGRVWR